MKILITYSNNGTDSLSCFAGTTLPNGMMICECADTFEEAKEALLAKIIKRAASVVPPPEEVEFDGPNQ